MDLSSKRSRVVSQNYASRLGQETQTFQRQANSLEGGAVDAQILQLLKSLTGPNDLDFSELLSTHLEKISCDLRLAYHFLGAGDRSGLDGLAQQLTQNALKVGAVQILSSAIELQGLARWGAFSDIEQLLGNLELELAAVRQQLA